MTGSEFVTWIMKASAAMPAYEKELCLLDTQIGDGDHGVTIARGYSHAVTDVLEKSNASVFCKEYAEVISSNMGGAIGPIYGLLWGGMATALKDRDSIGSAEMADGFLNAVKKIQTVCRVNAGEKTVFDALLPAAAALDENRELPLPQALALAVQVADAGRDATRDMLARKGRARFLAERSLGHLDAGASSFALFMKELQKAL